MIKSKKIKLNSSAIVYRGDILSLITEVIYLKEYEDISNL
jgi:hypothetical protein